MGFFDRFFKRKKKERSLLDLIDEAGLELEVSIKSVDLSKELDKNSKDKYYRNKSLEGESNE